MKIGFSLSRMNFSKRIAVSEFLFVSPINKIESAHFSPALKSAQESFENPPERLLFAKISSVESILMSFLKLSGNKIRTSPTPVLSAVLWAIANPRKTPAPPPTIKSFPACDFCSGLLHSISGKSNFED